MTTYIKPSRESTESFFVETWYNRQERAWVTQLKNADWDQLGEADYAGTKDQALREHERIVASIHAGARCSVLHKFAAN
jgi:hypothetical protein